MKIASQKYLYPFAVFLTGGCVLVIEVVATRMLATTFGGTIFTISSVISVILAALSLGYYFGGKMADKKPRSTVFFSLILIGGILLLAFQFLATLLLPILGQFLSLIWGPLIASVLFFFFPAFFLGMLSPFAIKLAILQEKEGVGTVSGRIFFWSTLGSILGSLLTGFVFIPHFGINAIMLTTGLVLVVLGLLPLFFLGGKREHIIHGVFLTVIFFSFALYVDAQDNYRDSIDVLYDEPGVYRNVMIYDGEYSGRPARFLHIGRNTSAAMYLDAKSPTDVVFPYTEYYKIYDLFDDRMDHALVIGGGAYTIPKAILATWPESHVDVSEVEERLYPLAKKYFALEDSPRLFNTSMDGRRFLEENSKKYDLIFSDVYNSLMSIPPEFTTKEFFALAKSKLSPNGIFLANVIGSSKLSDRSFFYSEFRTFREVFPNAYIFAVRSPQSQDLQNFIFVGVNGDRRLDLASLEESENRFLQGLADRLMQTDEYPFTKVAKYPILTDDYAPVDYIMAMSLRDMY